MDILMPSLKTILHLFHLMGLASPQMSTPTTGDHATGKMGLVSPLQWCPRCNGVPAAIVSPLQQGHQSCFIPSAGLPPPNDGHITN